MTRIHLRISILVALVCAVAALPAFAAGNGVPSYPNGVNKLAGMPPSSGMVQLETADAVSKVDAWYGAHLPKNCTHETAQGGAKYACPNVSIMIGPNQGKTLITHIPAMGGMSGH